MLVLALDTTTRRGSCAVVRDGRVIREDTSEPDRAHATRLPADMMVLLARTDVHLRDIDAFAVATGPGSFTGLRIGIAAMQGLALAQGRPLVGVSTLDALAATVGDGHVATWVDAWRGEVYAAGYRDGVMTEEPRVALPHAILPTLHDEVTFIGDGAETFRDTIASALGDRARFHASLTPALAGMVGQIAARAVLGGEHPLPHAVQPIYVRRPDVEIARETRRGD